MRNSDQTDISPAENGASTSQHDPKCRRFPLRDLFSAIGDDCIRYPTNTWLIFIYVCPFMFIYAVWVISHIYIYIYISIIYIYIYGIIIYIYISYIISIYSISAIFEGFRQVRHVANRGFQIQPPIDGVMGQHLGPDRLWWFWPLRHPMQSYVYVYIYYYDNIWLSHIYIYISIIYPFIYHYDRKIIYK